MHALNLAGSQDILLDVLQASNTIYFMLGGENGPIFDSFCFTFEKWNKGGNGKVFGTFVHHFRT